MTSSNQKQLYRKNRKKNTKENMFLIPDRKRIEKIESRKLLFHPLIYKNNLIFEIEWEKGEKEIYLTGSFGRVNKNFVYKKSQKRYTYSKLDINKQFRKLKFKVNGNIKISSIYAISNSKINSKKEENLSLYHNNETLSVSTKDSSSDFLQTNVNNQNVDILYAKKNYCNYFPKKNEMREKAEKIPFHFPKEFYQEVNKFHNEIGEKEFLNLKETNIFNSNNDSYKAIDKKDHLLLNHFTHNKNKIFSLTIRYRHKNTTFVYYK